MTRATSALHLSALAAAALAAAACSDSLPSVPERTIAYTVLATQQNVAGDAFVLRPTALFFRTNSLNLPFWDNRQQLGMAVATQKSAQLVADPLRI